MRRALAEATRALVIDAAAIELDEGDTWPVRFAEGLPTDDLGRPLSGRAGDRPLREPHSARPWC